MERLRMGASMFDTAKKMAKDSILGRNPKMSLQDFKKELFLRFYGQELSEMQIKHFLNAIKA